MEHHLLRVTVDDKSAATVRMAAREGPPPSEAEDYLHRSGRTARAGATGSVVTLVLPDQIRAVDKLTAAAGVTATRTTVHSSGAELARITGARTPSGVPVVIAAPVTAVRPERRGARGSKRLRYGAKAPHFRSGRTAPTTSTSRRRNAT
jgi:superfamily II DNA/RNA helicase